jgi:hypothetical protein
MERELVSDSAKNLVEKIGEKYSIGKSQVYKRVGHLKIKFHKENGKFWLDSDQLLELDKLDEHLKLERPMEEYQPSGALVHAPESNAAISESVQTVEIEAEAIEAEQLKDNHSFQQSLLKAAQSQAAGQIITRNILASHFVQNPHLLNPRVAEINKPGSPKPYQVRATPGKASGKTTSYWYIGASLGAIAILVITAVLSSLITVEIEEELHQNENRAAPEATQKW